MVDGIREVIVSTAERDKADIVQNAIDLAHALGNPMPKVAILKSAVLPQIGLPAF